MKTLDPNKLIEEVEKMKKPYWHIQFTGTSDDRVNEQRDIFNKETTVLLNSVINDVITKIKEMGKE